MIGTLLYLQGNPTLRGPARVSGQSHPIILPSFPFVHLHERIGHRTGIALFSV